MRAARQNDHAELLCGARDLAAQELQLLAGSGEAGMDIGRDFDLALQKLARDLAAGLPVRRVKSVSGLLRITSNVRVSARAFPPRCEN